jgi:hypothetical protein
VPCKSCLSANTRPFDSEIAIHFPGLAGLNKPHVWVFPKLTVCLDCGFAEFEIPEEQMTQLAEVDSLAS